MMVSVNQTLGVTYDMDQSFKCLAMWDAKFDLNSCGASFWLHWEKFINKYFHETTIGSEDFRRSLNNHPAYMSGFVKKAHGWSKVKATLSPMCDLIDFDSMNSCQEFLTYNLRKTVQYMQFNHGGFQPDQYEWKWALD